MPSHTLSQAKQTSAPERVYHNITAVTEWVENYKIGGFHPIHLGDYLAKDRYKVIRKLGYGSYSTVWLAKDTNCNRYVAIKVPQAKAAQNSNELKLLRHLKQKASNNQYSRHILMPIDDFQQAGPNGTHQCLVYEVSGPHLATLMLRLSGYGRRPDYFTLDLMRTIIRHVLKGAIFLHNLGICHGDLQPGNILCNISDISGLKESDFYVKLDPVWDAPSVRRLDGKELDASVPRHLLTSESLLDKVKFDKNFMAKITDFGGAFFTSNPPKDIVTPIGLRAPELMLGLPVNESMDIWSLGCLIFEIVASVPLFCIMGWNLTPDEIDDEYYMQLIEVMGPLPENLRSRWKRYSLCYGSDGRPKKHRMTSTPPIREYLFEYKPEDMNEAEADSFLSLVRQMLQYDPAKRISAREALKHPWLAGKVRNH